MEDIKKVNDESTVYLCENCGGSMSFDIGKQKLVCEYCGAESESSNEESLGISEYDLETYLNKETLGNWKSEARVMECTGCGAEIIINNEEAAKFCSFCGSSHVTEGHENALIKPEGILPFQIESHKAKEALEKWIKTRYLSPNDLKTLYSSENIKAIYVPYWTFDANTTSFYTGEGGKNYYENVTVNGKSVRRKKTNWYPVSGNVSLFFDDIQVNASKNFNEIIMNEVEPFTMAKLVPYEKRYLGGYIAERYTKGIKPCFELAKKEMEDKIDDEARHKILKKYDEASVDSINVRYSDCKFKHILLPVWTASYDYKGKKYRYVINGETGKISGEIPYSMAKIIFLIILIGIAIGIIYMRG
ncbi:MAG: hypothetical protein ACRC30_13980 [Clostridium sp.]